MLETYKAELKALVPLVENHVKAMRKAGIRISVSTFLTRNGVGYESLNRIKKGREINHGTAQKIKAAVEKSKKELNL